MAEATTSSSLQDAEDGELPNVDSNQNHQKQPIISIATAAERKECSQCKQVKVRKDFSQKQWKKRDDGNDDDDVKSGRLCVSCISANNALRKSLKVCSECKQFKSMEGFFNTQWKKRDGNDDDGSCRLCIRCLQAKEKTMNRPPTIPKKVCSQCKQVKSKAKFFKRQWKKGDDDDDPRRCKSCLERERKNQNCIQTMKNGQVCRVCSKLKHIQCFGKDQRKNPKSGTNTYDNYLTESERLAQPICVDCASTTLPRPCFKCKEMKYRPSYSSKQWRTGIYPKKRITVDYLQSGALKLVCKACLELEHQDKETVSIKLEELDDEDTNPTNTTMPSNAIKEDPDQPAIASIKSEPSDGETIPSIAIKTDPQPPVTSEQTVNIKSEQIDGIKMEDEASTANTVMIKTEIKTEPMPEPSEVSEPIVIVKSEPTVVAPDVFDDQLKRVEDALLEVSPDDIQLREFLLKKKARIEKLIQSESKRLTYSSREHQEVDENIHGDKDSDAVSGNEGNGVGIMHDGKDTDTKLSPKFNPRILATNAVRASAMCTNGNNNVKPRMMLATKAVRASAVHTNGNSNVKPRMMLGTQAVRASSLRRTTNRKDNSDDDDDVVRPPPNKLRKLVDVKDFKEEQQDVDVDVGDNDRADYDSLFFCPSD